MLTYLTAFQQENERIVKELFRLLCGQIIHKHTSLRSIEYLAERTTIILIERCPMNSENASIWRGDVYYADLGENKGSVQSGVRPVVIVQNNTGNHEDPTLIVVPISSHIKKLWLPAQRVSTGKIKRRIID